VPGQVGGEEDEEEVDEEEGYEEEEEGDTSEEKEGDGEGDEIYESAQEEEDIVVKDGKLQIAGRAVDRAIDWRAELALLGQADADDEHARHLTLAEDFQIFSEPKRDREARTREREGPSHEKSAWAAQFLDLEAEEEDEWGETEGDSSGFSSEGEAKPGGNRDRGGKTFQGHVIAG
jgi:hypothetical protein